MKKLAATCILSLFPTARAFNSFVTFGKWTSICKHFGARHLCSKIEVSKQEQLQDLIQSYDSSQRKRVLEDTLSFPTYFQIKVIGLNAPNFAPEIVKTIASCIGDQPKPLSYSLKEASGGKYVSLSIKPSFVSAAEIYSTYDELSKDKRVKFVL